MYSWAAELQDQIVFQLQARQTVEVMKPSGFNLEEAARWMSRPLLKPGIWDKMAQQCIIKNMYIKVWRRHSGFKDSQILLFPPMKVVLFFSLNFLVSQNDFFPLTLYRKVFMPSRKQMSAGLRDLHTDERTSCARWLQVYARMIEIPSARHKRSLCFDGSLWSGSAEPPETRDRPRDFINTCACGSGFKVSLRFEASGAAAL